MPRSNASSRTSTLSKKSSRAPIAGDRPAVTIPPLDSKVWENIYELPNDTETEEPHGSVIGHLFSQLKPGMDLTRVVLPTWILERRSLLEMFADFFVHPTEFISIAHGSTPADRMIQCLKWYLSSFHAGRPSDIAKKPYNPIIGETFTCWIPPSQEASSSPGNSASKTNENASAASAAIASASASVTPAVAVSNTTSTGKAVSGDALVDGSPIPAVASEHNLTFIAEQVSHRPPVSCFYTESIKDRISMTAHIWTKSRFMGLSIGMECVGHGAIVLHDKGDEEYIVTFPKAYGRSILTTPWFEMGGTCHINCEKTGFSAKIEFHEKPLIGGQKHRITAEVKSPNEKNPIFKVEGHWNDKMFVLESHKKKKEKDAVNDLFVDTKSLPVVKKQTIGLDKQLETESRRQWREVTWCLKNNVVDGATYFKTSLEEKQREGERTRQERGIKWTPKHFQEQQDGSFVFFSPLARRLRRIATAQ